MKYEEWRKLAVFTSDIRTLMIDGYHDFPEPCPGVVFMQPKIVVRRDDFPQIERFDNLGVITQNKNGTWSVHIETTEKDFVTLEAAARYLWDEWYKDELDAMPFLLLYIDREGEVNSKWRFKSEQQMIRHVRSLFQGLFSIGSTVEDQHNFENAEADLKRVGARFHEFMGGHLIAIPLE
jgi:hypothetical protein